MTHYQTTLESPIGLLRLVATSDALVAIDFDATPDGRDDRAHPLLVRARRELEEYFAGTRSVFDLPLAPEGSDWQRRVWRALEKIPFARTTSYGELARTLDRPRAARAVGAANGRNPIPIVIPCHRVIGADGTLTGFGGGIDKKRWLLDHERRSSRSVAEADHLQAARQSLNAV